MHLLAAAAAGLCQVLSLIPLHFGLLSPAANARECCFDTCLPDAAKQDFVLGNANTACITPETEIVSAEVDSCKLGSFTGWRKQVLKRSLCWARCASMCRPAYFHIMEAPHLVAIVCMVRVSGAKKIEFDVVGFVCQNLLLECKTCKMQRLSVHRMITRQQIFRSGELPFLWSACDLQILHHRDDEVRTYHSSQQSQQSCLQWPGCQVEVG